MIKFIKLLCIKNAWSAGLTHMVEEGKIYYADNYSYMNFVEIYHEYTDLPIMVHPDYTHRGLGLFHKSSFITLGEHREQQINSILNE